MMRAACIGTLGAVLPFVAACATGPKDPSIEGARAGVLEREQAWADAIRARDTEALRGILAGEFRLTFVDLPGAPPEVTREQWLGNLAVMSFGPVTMSDQRVTMHGDNVATVRMRMVLEEWTVPDRTLPPVYDLTDTWVLRDGRWQVVSRISEPVESGGR